MNVTFKRIIAFILDWNFTLFPTLIVFHFVTAYLQKQSEVSPLFVLLLFLILILSLVAFILRDIIRAGRSLGKRIFGLYIYDKQSLDKASIKQRFLRNLFLFIYTVDGIVLLVTRETIGDKVAGTLVAPKQDPQTFYNQFQHDSTTPPKSKKGVIILIVAIIITFLIVIIGSIQFALNKTKNTQEYKLAYSYLTESESFKQLNVDESKIRFNEYSSHTYSANNDSVTQTTKISFTVKFNSFTVVCHKENGVWQVCEECTLFE